MPKFVYKIEMRCACGGRLEERGSDVQVQGDKCITVVWFKCYDCVEAYRMEHVNEIEPGQFLRVNYRDCP